ncbi:hypothetical protein HU200_053986 [Digitaria exilis]|uniref:Uncharacterized protein n=1 Tax=Digitaria exilis TaxID=1010633 RepID=A0A835AL90_9POAL|nr:hypothetical protein HU200_053986 [Digitaria exilis]CAB3492226.1 unnamed protein product [Digitaria exilis]
MYIAWAVGWGGRIHRCRLLAGKVAFVTGATSALGEKIARKFAKNGAKVILADLQSSNCQTLASTINTATNRPATQLHDVEAMDCDVRDTVDFVKAIENAKSNHNGRLDIFYNHVEFNHVSSISARGIFSGTMSANVESVMNRVEHVGAVMRSEGDGDDDSNYNGGGKCILLTSNTMGLLGDVVPSAYSISHAAVVGVIRAAAARLAKDGVRVNAISPATVDERVLKSIFPRATSQQIRDMIKDYMNVDPVSDDDVANAAVFMASKACKSVNGHNLVLSGKFPLY